MTPQAEQRFVLYLPQASQARIVGTFTDWNPVPMQKIGASGYWSLTLKVPQGEHRYSYLVEGDNRMVDPTVAAREHDDFGGENSVIVVGGGDDPVS
jgi:1,4-alpha-glucan branching enzyme